MSPLTILVASINTVGHVNACVGATSLLLKRGHRVVFVLETSWKGKLTPLGFEEHLYQTESSQKGANSADVYAKLFQDLGMWSGISPRQKSMNFKAFFESLRMRDENVCYNGALVEAIERFKPDVILSDEFGLMPAIHYSGIPWIRLFSCNPLFFYMDKELPPGGSGLPFNDRSEWEDFNKSRDFYFHSKEFNDFVESLGYPRYPADCKTPPSQSLIVYACPKEWNYPPLQDRPGWFNLEVFNKNDSGELVDLAHLLPKNFWTGNSKEKLIYVSMGSMGSINIELMKRLIKILAKTPHKYIFSKGPLHDQYELEKSNQWGARFLPQMKLIPQVDLVITHGGNNSVTEIFAQGKPMIVLPLFADQYDNAQRLQETGYSVRVDPFNFKDEELINAIEHILKDDQLTRKLKTASKRVQSTDRHMQLAVAIEHLVERK